MAFCCFDPLEPILQKLLDCVTVALVDCGYPACNYYLSADANPAWDDCCECDTGNGRVWVQLVSIVPDVSPGYSNTSLVDCATEMAANVSINILRCAPVSDTNGRPPSVADLTAAAKGQMRDAAIMRSAIRCCFAQDDPQNHPESVDAANVSFGEWTPLGPDGGCMGGSQVVQVMFTDYACGNGPF